MPVITQKFVHRSDLQCNPGVLYLFGDNLKRVGLGGQAKSMRGEPNAVGIPTKKAPGMDSDNFFADRDLSQFETIVTRDLEPVVAHLRAGGLVVIPEDGLGTGLSELPERAPALNHFLKTALNDLRAIEKE